MSWATTALKTALSKIVPQYWNSATSDWEPVEGSGGAMNTQLIGSNMELYGASIGDRPLAGDVPVGATFTIADPASDFPTWMSDGTDWQEVV